MFNMIFYKNNCRISAIKYISAALLLSTSLMSFASCYHANGSETEHTDTQKDFYTESESDRNFPTDIDSLTDEPTDSGTSEPVDSDSDTDKETETDTEMVTDFETETETETEKETETETEPATETEPEEPDVEKLFGVDLSLEKSFGLEMKYVDETVMTRGSVYLRTEPSSLGGESTKVTVLTSMTNLRRIGYSNTWSRVLYEGRVCYVSSKYLVPSAPQNDPTGIYYKGTGANASKVIVIDAGHQTFAMNDVEPNGPGSNVMKPKVSSGTVGCVTGVWEYVLNLDVAMRLKDLCLDEGYSVVMIRESNNVTISNAERAEIANRYNAAAFIRIHANYVSSSATNGALTMCQSRNNKYNGNLYDESAMLSSFIINEFCDKTGIENLGVTKTDTMTGINWCQVPATIVEMGFMSNPDEDRYMATNEFKDKAALGIFNGIVKFISENEIVG